MKRRMMRNISLLLMTLILLMCIPVNAVTNSSVAPVKASYADALDRLTSLGIISSEDGFKQDSLLTREQFSKLIVIIAGLEASVDSMKGPTIFSDIAADYNMNGYINIALGKGYITGKVDGKFHIKDSMSFAQVCTAMIKVLGYAVQDVPGTWPRNYVEKAKALGITTGITLTANNEVPVWAMVVMLDKLLDTNIKKNNPADPDKTLAESSGLTPDAMLSEYGKPEIYLSSKVIGNILGGIDFSKVTSIVRNTVDNTVSPAVVTAGESISTGEINDYNVIYPVQDKSGNTVQLLVIDNKITGTIKSILPNKLAPKTVKVDNTEYTLDANFDAKKLDTTAGSFNINDDVTLLLGYDGKVVDMISAEESQNTNFAFAINYTADTTLTTSNTTQKQYSVKLMLTNGITKTYATNADPSAFKGKLVTYIISDDGSVVLQSVNYEAPGEVCISKSDQLLYYSYLPYTNYITSNVKIFNFISNPTGADAQVQLLKLSDLPSGSIPSGKILHMNKTGDFSDINLILASDISSDKYNRIGFVKSYRISGQNSISATILIDGSEYTYSGPCDLKGLNAGSVVKVMFQNGKISFIQEKETPFSSNTTIQAIDAYRLRINNINCWFKSNSTIYFIDVNGAIKKIGTKDIKTTNYYNDVSVYFDKPSAQYGKAEVVIIKEQP